MAEAPRPDPDALLERLRGEERSPGRGRLKIFFGAAAGVGKTFAMLGAARERQAAGVDVVVGHVDTHGRPETDAQRAGLPELPRRAVSYRGATLQEFDLDAALARKPALLILDELAHTNAPGSRHERRFQDVLELLAAGIDVYTTLNVQHLESLNDLVTQVTGVVVRETIPDSVVETADEVELIDLPPDELLARLREGKVYVPPQAERAMANFFRKANLVALRELALRCAADRVDAQMQVYRRTEGGGKAWPITERVLVCVSPSPSAARVVRAGRRLARRLRADWIVLSVELPRHAGLAETDRGYAEGALRLAERLGAETVTLAAHDAVAEIVAFARSRNVSRIVVGKPAGFWWLRDLFAGSFVDAVVRQSGEIDVIVVHGRDEGEAAPPTAAPPPAEVARWQGYPQATAVVAAATAIAWAMSRMFAPPNLVMIYLLGVVVVAAQWGRGPSLVAAILGVGAFDFFFVPPYYSFAVSDYQYLVTFAAMTAVAVIVSTLTARIREQAQIARQRERRTAGLYALSRELASTRSLDAMIAAVKRHVGEAFDGRVAVYLASEGGGLEPRGEETAELAADAKETAVARWVHEHSEPAGRGTATLSAAAALHLPLIGSRGPVGVLALRLDPDRGALGTDRMHLLETFSNQTALALERALLAREAHRHRLEAEGESLRNALLAAVSHDLRTPLAAISGAASGLALDGERLDPSARRELVLTIREEAERMARLANNLLDMGRLQGGRVVLRREWTPLEEVVGAALRSLDAQLRGRDVEVRLGDELPLIPMDDVLVERVLTNLLENAARYTPPGSPLRIVARVSGAEVEVEVSDHGPGLAPGDERRVFDKFFRGAAASSHRGVGIGLALARTIVEAHGGRIEAESRPGGGATFRFTLPVGGAPPEAPA